jgi:hypothetical protein
MAAEKMSAEQRRQLNFLAAIPNGSTTMTRADLKTILLETGGNMLACGRLYDIVAKDIGAGVYKVTLALTHP